MVRVGEDDLRAHRLQTVGGDGLDRSLSADRHEARGLHRPPRSLEKAGPRVPVLGFDREGEVGQPVKTPHRCLPADRRHRTPSGCLPTPESHPAVPRPVR